MEHRTQAAILRTAWAKDAAKTMLEVVQAITKRAKLITGIALGASMPHQMLFLISACIPHMRLDSLTGWLDAIGMIIIAVAVPVVADIAIYNCIDTLGAQIATGKSKIRAYGFLIMPVAASGYVNFLAPAPMLLKGLAAFLVAMILIAQGLRFIEVDWEKLEKFESDNAIVIEDAEDVTRAKRLPLTEAQKRARKRALYGAMTASEKLKYRIAERAKEQARTDKEVFEQIDRELDGVIPVSPAPAGVSL